MNLKRVKVIKADEGNWLLNLSRAEFERYVDDGEMTHQDILDLWDAAVAAEAKEKKLREEMGILSIKVKILFLTNYVYSDSSFEVLDELILPLNDAKELVNKGVAVIDYIYNVRSEHIPN